jgi:hypothetical protein
MAMSTREVRWGSERRRSRRARWRVLAAPCVLLTSLVAHVPAARGQDIPAAVFDFDLIDTSQEGASGAMRDDEARRLALMGEALRRMLGERGLAAVDLAPARARIDKARPVARCNGCDLDLARELGADLAVTGFVQKVSNLILNINVAIRDARTGAIVRAGSVDIRGNTDESWSRGISYLVRNRLFDTPLPGRPP